MTDGQLRYRTLMEDQRHNLAMERIGSSQAESAARSAAVREREQSIREEKLPVELQQMRQNLKVQALTTGIQGAQGFIKALGDTYGVMGQIIKLAAI